MPLISRGAGVAANPSDAPTKKDAKPIKYFHLLFVILSAAKNPTRGTMPLARKIHTQINQGATEDTELRHRGHRDNILLALCALCRSSVHSVAKKFLGRV